MASLIYHAGALGDFITTLPAISCWRKDHPGEHSILLGRPVHAALAAPPFDETWDAEAAEFSALFSGSVQADSPLAAKLRTVSSALLFTAASSLLPASLARMGVREIVSQDPFPPSVVHATEYHLSLFPAVDRGEHGIPRILFAEHQPLDAAALHPGSGSAKKNWPRGRFFELAEGLIERGVRIAWVLGPAEAGMELPPSVTHAAAAAPNPPAAALNPPAAVVWRSLPLPVLAARLAQCRLYVGNDSGVTHLAAATGCPTVALFGESDPRVWAPRGERVTVLGSGHRGMEAIDIADVFSACVDFLEKR